MKPPFPLVSIGLPTYSRVTTLRRAIDSAIAQDYANLEIIISDNASTDETESVCRAYARQDSRIRYIRHSVNRGATPNLSYVLSESKGEFFMWLADDDWLDPSYVRECLEELQAHPEYSLVCGADMYYRSNDYVYNGPKLNVLEKSALQRLLSYFQAVSCNGTFYGLMRRATLSRLSLDDKLGGDWLLIGTVAYLGKIRTLENVYIHRSVEGESENVKHLARRTGHTGIWARYPLLKVAWNVFIEIAWSSPNYSGETIPQRVRVACKAATTIIYRYCWPQLIQEFLNWTIAIRLGIRRSLEKHLLWRFHSH